MLEQVTDKTWKLYEDGITATMNQADTDNAMALVQRYKPKNLAELTAFVAGIRPGFASLLENFIERKPYSTGVSELDELLETSFHYMMYQESVMATLKWLGIPEKDTYDVIKKISKKKFTEEQKQELKERLRNSWIEKIGNDDKFDEIWTIIEDFCKYGFNASHALSVAIDSLYGAMLKSNYPLEYYTVCFNEYIDDIDKTAHITSELPYFNITVNKPKFRYSKSNYIMDKDTNSIYKGIQSIKFLNGTVADEVYGLKDNEYKTFTDLVHDIRHNTGMNFKQLKILTSLNFFVEFGKNKKLLEVIDKYETRLKNKSLKESTQLARLEEVRNFEAELPNKSLSVKEQLIAETTNLGYQETTKESLPDSVYYVVSLEPKKTSQTVLYRIKTGELITVKCLKADAKKQIMYAKDNIIKMKSYKEKAKRRRVIEKIDGEEKIKYVPSDEKEMYITSWDILM